MIFGICGPTDENGVKIIKEMGFRYIETWLPSLSGENNKARYEEFLRALDKNKLRCEVGQFAFPGEFNQENGQSKEALEKIEEYVYNLLDSTRDLFIEKLVIGAGGARIKTNQDKSSDNYLTNYNENMYQMSEILKRAVSPAIGKFGVTVVLEPLVKGETSILNTTDEAVELCKRVDLPNIKTMTDLYHAANEGEDFSKFSGHKGFIMHAHIGKPSPRVHPAPNDGQDYAPFINALKSAGYNGRLSLEAGLSCDDYKISLENAIKVLEPLL